jgi:transketolase
LTESLTGPTETGRPALIIADTNKGRGISFMEDAVKWHHGVPSEEEFERALDELTRAERALVEAGR